MKWFYSLVLLTAGSTAHAAERWPPTVCAEILANAQDDSKAWGNFPWERRISRASNLIYLQNHCGVDVRALIAEYKAVRPPPTGPAGSSGKSMVCKTVRHFNDNMITTCE
jgi:hypothetical protein